MQIIAIIICACVHAKPRLLREKGEIRKKEDTERSNGSEKVKRGTAAGKEE